MAENVVPELVADDEERLGVAGFLEGGVPDDHALGGANTRDVGVHLVAFFAGAHEKDAIAGNGDAGALREFLNGSDELGMLLVERLEVVEERIDDPRNNKDEGQQNGQGGKPKKEPPAPRAATHYGEQNQGQDERKERANDFFLGPIPKPGAPALHGLLVAERERMPIQADG